MSRQYTSEQKERNRKVSKEWYLSNKSRQRANAKKWIAKNRGAITVALAVRIRRNIHFVNAYKLFMGCEDCGYGGLAIVLQADHLHSKGRYTVSQLVMAGRSLLLIYRELLKCEIRCANCHTIKHYYNRKFRVVQEVLWRNG